jgi:restriction system protein
VGLPSFQELLLPTLGYVCGRSDDIPVAELEEGVARVLALASEDLSILSPNGRRTAFANRLEGASAYLAGAALIETPRPGVVRGNARGRALLAEGIREIDAAVLSRFPEFRDWRLRRQTDAPDCQDPEARIAKEFDRLDAELSRALIERVHSFSPAFFERLIVDLLVRMGYGGGRAEMGRALGRVGDGGVDGVIKEDELGLDVVYVQAKRFARENCVPLREVRDFVGGLEGHRATKGVFVTTSYYPSTAHAFVSRLSKRVVLIDGPQLARLMIRHKVGVRVKESYEVKRIDEDYFVE